MSRSRDLSPGLQASDEALSASGLSIGPSKSDEQFVGHRVGVLPLLEAGSRCPQLCRASASGPARAAGIYRPTFYYTAVGEALTRENAVARPSLDAYATQRAETGAGPLFTEPTQLCQ